MTKLEEEERIAQAAAKIEAGGLQALAVEPPRRPGGLGILASLHRSPKIPPAPVCAMGVKAMKAPLPAAAFEDHRIARLRLLAMSVLPRALIQGQVPAPAPIQHLPAHTALVEPVLQGLSGTSVYAITERSLLDPPIAADLHPGPTSALTLPLPYR